MIPSLNQEHRKKKLRKIFFCTKKEAKQKDKTRDNINLNNYECLVISKKNNIYLI